MTTSPMPSVWAAPWSRPYRQGVVVGGEPARLTREGVLIALQRGGRCAIGDAAPLPGLSTDTVGDVITGLKAAVAAIDGLAHGDPGRLSAVTPSMAWAVWSAWTALGAQSTTRPSVRSAVLVDDNRPLPAGTVVKIKVGRGDLVADIARIHHHRQAGHVIRLDGNRRLTTGRTIELAEAAGDALAFFEEPTASALRPTLPEWLPIALDESLADGAERAPIMADMRDGARAAAAWVIKPSTLPPAVTADLVRMAQRRGIPVIVSSAFDSSVGRRALVRFAASVAPDGVHGLGTSGVWLRDLVADTGDIVVEADGAAAVGDELDLDAITAVRWERLR